MKFLSLMVVLVSCVGLQAQTRARGQVMKSAKMSPPEQVFFISPKDGATVKSPFKIQMGVKGMEVCEANKPTENKRCGHHHLLIDGAFVPEGQPVPKNETHIHYGQMQKEAEITLAPGKHTLTLQFADYAHISYGEKLSATITVTVK